ncbi:hypothetical protein GR925_00010 [Streptomyces sp. HUCO-GS316]|uniref:hypothetical protein n=1 Tax=Streptomyces sp. HUCO-GS316 TaxID=2692198 RepID=UPI00136CD4D3|nr:hypothetical protein [Streptomyces sp. HUCO-GS316]MXM61877.1 hypothetical protein [Streptomyces sp. HUCO-GS316]
MLIRRERRPEDGPYWTQRNWQLSAGFLALVVLLGGFVALTSDKDGATAAASDGPLSGTSVPRDGRPEGCRTDDSAGDAQPTSAPKDISWHTLGIAKVPVSASAGPTRTSGPLRWCYAHTPAGAALAATVIPSQMSGSGWKTVSRQQVVAGRGRDLFEFQRSTVPDIDSAAQSGGASVGSYAGFSVTSYTRREANVGLLIRTGQGYATTGILLRWDGGDWKVLPNDDGSLHTPVTAVQGNPNGYILWGV